MSGVDEEEFAAMLAAATLARAGLLAETMDAAGHAPPAPRIEDNGKGGSDRPRPAATASVPAAAPYRLTPPAPAVDVDVLGTVNTLNNSTQDYRITGNDNAVITRDGFTKARAQREGNLGRCRAVCGEPLAPALIDRPADSSGLHANCIEPAPPPSTLAMIEPALARYESSRPRSVQRTLGPSELGTPCRRQIAMKLAGVEQHERGGLPWAPMCGTAVHGLMEAVLHAENDRAGKQLWVIEETVQLDEELHGHGDAYYVPDALVVDWKYTGTTARRKAARKTVPNDQLVSADYRVQAHLYGLGHENAGRPVRHVRLVMLARSHDFRESVEWTEEYRPDIAIDAMTRFYATRDEVTNRDMATHPERLAEIESTPGEACKWCPFRRPTPAGGLDVDATGCVGDTASHNDVTAYFR